MKRENIKTIAWALVFIAFAALVAPAFAVMPHVFATQPAGNVPASYLDSNFTFVENQGVQAITTTGSANAYVATPSDAWTVGYSSYSGRALTIVPNFTNTNTATINVSALGAVSIYKNVAGVSTGLVAGDLVSGIPAVIICDGTNFLLANPPIGTTVGGGMTLLNTVNAVGASSVAFSSTYITSAYNKYIIEFDGVTSTGGTGSLSLQESTDNGLTYITSGTYHWVGTYQSNDSGTSSGTSSAAATSIAIDLAQSYTNGSQASGTVKFSNPSASNICRFIWEMTGSLGNSSANLANGTGNNATTTAINNIRFIIPSGGIITGNFHLYGLSGI